MAAKKHTTRHAKHATHHAVNGTTTSAATSSTGNGETDLTGATLTSASGAALAAVPGGTVDRARTETDSSVSGAAYEVHVTKADGSNVLVVEDASFAVISTAADAGGCHGSMGASNA